MLIANPESRTLKINEIDLSKIGKIKTGENMFHANHKKKMS